MTTTRPAFAFCFIAACEGTTPKTESAGDVSDARAVRPIEPGAVESELWRGSYHETEA